MYTAPALSHGNESYNTNSPSACLMTVIRNYLHMGQHSKNNRDTESARRVWWMLPDFYKPATTKSTLALRLRSCYEMLLDVLTSNTQGVFSEGIHSSNTRGTIQCGWIHRVCNDHQAYYLHFCERNHLCTFSKEMWPSVLYWVCIASFLCPGQISITHGWIAGWSLGTRLELVCMIRLHVHDCTSCKTVRLVVQLSNPEVLFKALTLLVNFLYIFIYAYAPLP